MTDSSSSVAAPVTDGPASIGLIPYFQKDFTINGHNGYRLYVAAVDAHNMDQEIFRFYEYPADPLTGVVTAEFTGVCTWPDLEAYPANAPRDTDSPKVYRLYYFDIVVATQTIADDVWARVQADVQILVDSINAGRSLEAATTGVVTIS
jgi:hypothetical protein